MRPQSTLTIPITVTRHVDEPLHEQIAGQVDAAIRHGLLAPSAQLPSTRSLAALLGVSRGVIIAAYELLFTRGCVHSQLGSGTYVSGGPALQPQTTVTAGRSYVDLRPGLPSREAFPLQSWRAAWRRAGFRRPPAAPLPPLGLPRLRRSIAQHVWRTQGIPIGDKEVIVTGGREHGLRLVLQVLGLTGPAVAFEEPSPPALRRALPHTPSALGVDAHGARVHDLPPDCRAIVVSADAQIPHGHILSAKRREIAAQWALQGAGRHLIELACDTVSRPELSGLPRLSTLAGDRACLIGCFGELLTPGLRLGYAVVPRHVAAAAEAAIDERGEQPPHVTQLAVESLLEDGTVVRLMHRLGRLYAAKRQIVDRALATLGLRDATRGTVNSVVLRLPSGVDAQRLAPELLTRGVRVETLSPYHFSTVPRSALVIGYGHVPDPVLSLTLGAVADLVRARASL